MMIDMVKALFFDQWKSSKCDGRECARAFICAARLQSPAPLSVCASCFRCVSICSLAFSMEGLYLSASSNTETVHIFKLETQKEKYV